MKDKISDMDKNRAKDLDRFFQDKMNNRTFDYQDEYWTEMQALLSEKEVKRPFWKRNAWFLSAFLFVGLSAVSGWLMFPYLSNNQTNEAQINSFEKETIETKDKSNQTKTSIEKPQASLFDDTAIPSPYNQSTVVEITEPDNVFVAENSIPQPAEINKNTSLTNTFDESQMGNINQNNNTTTNITISNSDLTVVLAEESKANKSTKENKSNNNKELTAERSAASQSLESNYLQKLAFSKVETHNTGIKLIAPNCDGCPHIPKFRQFKLGFTAGVVAAQVWKEAASSYLDFTFDPTIGVSLDYSNSPIASWNIRTGFQYWSRSLFNTMQEYETTTYSFGSTTSLHQINIQELHYASVPVYAVYKTEKHQLIGGVNLNYLVNTQSQTAVNSTIYRANHVEMVDIPSEKQWGVIAPFNRFDFGLTLGYDYQLNDTWRVGGRINYGFVDVTKDDYFNANVFDNNLHINLSVTHDIFNYKF